MRYGIDIGHNCPPDTGARGIKFEDNLTLDVGNRVIAKLRALGHQVVECKPDKATTVADSLRQRCDRANRAKVDVFVSIHFNAFNRKANGTEIFAGSTRGHQIAKPILDEIVKLGFFNRGLKNGSHLFVIGNTNMPAILVECCFIDSQKDMSIFEAEAMANAIIIGLTGKAAPEEKINVIPDEKNNPDNSVLRLKRALNRLQIKPANGRTLSEDNVYDAQAKSAVERFQEIVGIQKTGVAGNTTWGAINEILAKRIIRRNHAGGVVVRYLQFRLNLDIDGIFGPQTENAVKAFQRSKGLFADGIIGPATWQKLIG